MIPFLLMIHVVIAVLIIGLVLIQQGKGANMGAAFGSGASQTMFGSKGSMSFLMKATGVLAALFFATSLTMGYITASKVRQANSLNAPSQQLPFAPNDQAPVSQQ